MCYIQFLKEIIKKKYPFLKQTLHAIYVSEIKKKLRK